LAGDGAEPGVIASSDAGLSSQGARTAPFDLRRVWRPTPCRRRSGHRPRRGGSAGRSARRRHGLVLSGRLRLATAKATRTRGPDLVPYGTAPDQRGPLVIDHRRPRPRAGTVRCTARRQDRVVPVGGLPGRRFEAISGARRPVLVAAGNGSGAGGGGWSSDSRGGGWPAERDDLQETADRRVLRVTYRPTRLRHPSPPLADGGADVRGWFRSLLRPASRHTTKVYTLVTVDKWHERSAATAPPPRRA